MIFRNLFLLYFILINSTLICHVSTQNPEPSNQQQLAAERTQAIARIFSFIQCLPNTTNSANLDKASQELIQIHQSFNPEDHLDQYSNLTEIQQLINFVKELSLNGTPDNLPFLNDPQSISNFQLSLNVLYHNTDNWPLFYNTSVWLLHRVNTAQLFWALNVVAPEKYGDTITVPSTVEIFPQLYVPKQWTLAAASKPDEQQQSKYISENKLYYWTTDPGLNEFHTHFHMDNPFWWDEKVYGTYLHRRGELFFYMHHIIVNKYNAELLSNGLPEVGPLIMEPDYPIPFGYQPDIVNIDFDEFPARPDGELFGKFDDGNITLGLLKTDFDRMWKGIEDGYLLGPDGSQISIINENGVNLLGSTVESENLYSANVKYYGSFHNLVHQLLGSMMLKKRQSFVPGVQSHQECAMNDRVFFQIHKKVDTLFVKYKQTLTKPYTKDELEFSGISILGLEIITGLRSSAEEDSKLSMSSGWPGTSSGSVSGQQDTEPIILTTYMQTETFDISNSARPCRTVNDPPTFAQVQTLNYQPFTYVIAVQSIRPQVAYGMVRIFLWPEYTLNGTKLEGDEAHVRAIELDRFRVRLDPLKINVIKRSSLNSTFTRVEPSPGIKELYNVQPGSNLLTDPAIRRACAFPNNMLIPRGSKEGVPFILTVYISDETDAGEVEDNQYPHYPMCGALKGLQFPDQRPMGFPFERPGTNFSVTGRPFGFSPIFGCPPVMTNVRQVKVVIKHNDQQERFLYM